MKPPRSPAPLITISLAVLAAQGAWADATVQERMSMDFSILKAHTTETSYYAGDRKRHEFQMACDGFMKLLCGKTSTLDITRLDQGVTWTIEDKQRSYTETGLNSPEQLQTAMQQQQAAYSALKSCPAARGGAPGGGGLDPSTCELSEPQVTLSKTGDHASLIGHDTQRTNITMTQSCKVRDTGEECQLAYSFDVWLTQDSIAGLSDRQAFDQAYGRKLGLQGGALTNATLSRAMAPYADTFRKLNARSGDLQGYALKTRFRFAYGGAHCRVGGAPASDPGSSTVSTAGQSAGQAAAGSTATAAGWSASEGADRAAGSGPAGYIAGSTAGAFARSLVGGMFSKRHTDDAPAGGTAPSQSLTANGQTLNTFADMTIETLSVDASPVAPARFEIPQGYRKTVPPAPATATAVSCPGT